MSEELRDLTKANENDEVQRNFNQFVKMIADSNGSKLMSDHFTMTVEALKRIGDETTT